MVATRRLQDCGIYRIFSCHHPRSPSMVSLPSISPLETLSSTTSTQFECSDVIPNEKRSSRPHSPTPFVGQRQPSPSWSPLHSHHILPHVSRFDVFVTHNDGHIHTPPSRDYPYTHQQKIPLLSYELQQSATISNSGRIENGWCQPSGVLIGVRGRGEKEWRQLFDTHHEIVPLFIPPNQLVAKQAASQHKRNTNTAPKP